jgi:signal peptidase II
MNKNFRLWLFCILFPALIALDQITKSIAKAHLLGKETFSYLYDTIRLVYVENTGAFLSLGSGWSDQLSFVVFVLLPLLFLILLGGYLIKNRNTMNLFVYLSMIFIAAGGFGNLIDRVLYHRHVTDFLNFGIGNVRTGILNFADMYVTTGVILLIVFYMKDSKKPKEVSGIAN